MTSLNKTSDVFLHALTAWPDNVRKVSNQQAQDELTASIRALGLLQPLVIRDNEGTLTVIAGKRRLLSLMALRDEGTISADFPVPCIEVPTDADSDEVGLAENVVREPMHPADQFEAFQRLISKGTKISDVALRFGVTEDVIRQRLKLANVSPKIIKAFRANELDLGQVMAFAVTDDKKRQEKLLKDEMANSAEFGLEAGQIRRALTEGHANATDKRALYVGLEAYEAAGGTLLRDLFVADKRGIYLTDEGLLNQLTEKKLAEDVARLQADGWGWAELAVSYDYNASRGCTRADAKHKPLSKVDEAEQKKLQAEAEKLEGKDWNDMTEADEERSEVIQNRLAEIDAKSEYWPDSVKAKAGVIGHIGSDGRLELEYGYIRKQDAKAAAKAQRTEDGDDDDIRPSSGGRKISAPAAASDDDKAELTQALQRELTEHRTVMLAAAVTDRPKVALRTLLHHFIKSHRLRGYDTNLKIETQTHRALSVSSAVSEHKKASAYAQLKKMEKELMAQAPKADGALWDWCQGLKDNALTDHLALMAALSISTTTGPAWNPADVKLAHAAGLDPADYITLDVEHYFAQVSKALLLEHLRELPKGTVDLDEAGKMKKADLATFTAEQIQLRNPRWLPPALRLPAAPKTAKPTKVKKAKAQPAKKKGK